MPLFIRGDVRLAYDVHGPQDAPAVLLIAPGGMRSARVFWDRVPLNLRQLPGFRVVAMDQRNAGDSSGPADPRGWDAYTEDQLALLDHLGIDTFHAIGMCIGGPYIAGLARSPRLVSAVMMQPIGLDRNRDAFYDLFDAWARDRLEGEHPEFRQAMFGGDFLFNLTREQARTMSTPTLLLRGDDHYHPASISDELARLLPNCTFVREWKDRPQATQDAIEQFLRKHIKNAAN